MKKLLVVVDYQNDFIDGALGFAGAEQLAPRIAARIAETRTDGGDEYSLLTHTATTTLIRAKAENCRFRTASKALTVTSSTPRSPRSCARATSL